MIRISIVLPLYNSENYISETIKSVLIQTYKDWELIIIDDCSTDNSIEVVKEIQKSEQRIRLIQLNSNSGAAIARNEGIKEAKGEFIAFIDSDDVWQPNKLELQLKVMEEENSTLCHTSYSLFDESGKNMSKQTTCKKYITYSELIKYNWIGTSTVIFNARILGKHYMPDIRNRQDWALWLQLIKHAGRAHFIFIPLVKYTVRSGSISNNKIKLIKYHWFIYRKIEKFSFFKSILYLINNLMQHLLKSKLIANSL